jgi:5-methylcytosine-specific restriction enzyme A
VSWKNFDKHAVYNRRRDIHEVYGGQQQGGICTPGQHPVIFVFTGATGEQHGYADGWADDDVFRYFGEGQTGDMVFERGNRAIRDHLKNGKDLLLFQTLGRGQLRFLGQFDCAGYSHEAAPDSSGTLRQAIVFDLVPIELANRQVDAETAENGDNDQAEVNLAQMRERALEAAQSAPEITGRAARRNLYKRSQTVRRYVLARAAGVCELCNLPAPFQTAQGEPYLEPHHIRRLSDGGPDDPRFMAGLCPNCHREVHHGVGGPRKNSQLQETIKAKEVGHAL